MRLPHQLLESALFSFENENEFKIAIVGVAADEELQRINALLEKKLLPITSKEVLATLLGLNPGIIWSFVSRNDRHYRRFNIPKGKGVREILAPKVALKIVQKWISVQLVSQFTLQDHVFGFVPGRSHIEAAARHTEASWVFSVDIKDFFPSTPKKWVSDSLVSLGYDINSAALIADICCYRGKLAQGAPSSPVLSNICMLELDDGLKRLSEEMQIRVTRYADDVTFSSTSPYPEDLPERIGTLFKNTPWTLAEEKTDFAASPKRLKVHGLIVNDKKIKLTKGYRNKLRAYRHMIDSGRCQEEDLARLKGHLNFSKQIERFR
jgi:RNA-directed DNA polymerase